MNPEEGKLRPQIQDRFGLRVLVRGLTDSDDRLEVYRRVTAYQANPHALRATWAAETFAATAEVAEARARLPQVKLTPQELTRLAAARPLEPGAFQAYLRGRYALDKFTPEGSDQAERFFGDDRLEWSDDGGGVFRVGGGPGG